MNSLSSYLHFPRARITGVFLVYLVLGMKARCSTNQSTSSEPQPTDVCTTLFLSPQPLIHHSPPAKLVQ